MERRKDKEGKYYWVDDGTKEVKEVPEEVKDDKEEAKNNIEDIISEIETPKVKTSKKTKKKKK